MRPRVLLIYLSSKTSESLLFFYFVLSLDTPALLDEDSLAFCLLIYNRHLNKLQGIYCRGSIVGRKAAFIIISGNQRFLVDGLDVAFVLVDGLTMAMVLVDGTNTNIVVDCFLWTKH